MSEGQRAAKRHRHGDEVMIDRVAQVIPRELDRQFDPERSGTEPAAAFGEIAIAVASVGADSSAAAADERLAAQAPPARMIGDEERGADIVGARAGELVILRRARAGERDADVGRSWTPARSASVGPTLTPNGYTRDAGAVATPGEVQHVDQDRSVARLVIVGLELRRRDRAADEILEREAFEVQRLGDEAIRSSP